MEVRLYGNKGELRMIRSYEVSKQCGHMLKKEMERNDVSTNCHDITPLLQSMSQRQFQCSYGKVAKAVSEKWQL